MGTRWPHDTHRPLALRTADEPHHIAMNDPILSSFRRHRVLLLVSIGIVWLLVMLGLLAWWQLPRWAPTFTIQYAPSPDMVVRAMAHAGSMSDLNLAAFNRLNDMGTAATPALIAAIQHPEAWVRSRAIHILSHNRDPRAIEPILAAYADPEWEVRHSAVETMPIFDTGPRALELMVKALEDDNGDVRRAALWGLIAIPGPSSRAHLVRCLEREHLASPLMSILNEEVEEPVFTFDDLLPLIEQYNDDALHLTVRCDDPRLAEILAKAITTPARQGGKPTEGWRRYAAEALMENPTSTCQDMAVTLLQSPSADVRRIMTSGARLAFPKPSPRVAAALVSRLDDQDDNVIIAAIDTCARQEYAEAGSRVMALMDHRNPAIRAEAVANAGQFQHERLIIAKLTVLLHDPNPEVRLNAISGLSGFTQRSTEKYATAALLIPALADASPAVQKKAREEFSSFRSPKDIDAMVTGLANPDLHIRAQLVAILSQRELTEAQAEQVTAAKITVP